MAGSSKPEQVRIDTSKVTSAQNEEMLELEVSIPASLAPMGIHFISTKGMIAPRIVSFEADSRALGHLILGDTITHVNGILTTGAMKTENMIRSAVGTMKNVKITLLRQKNITVRFTKPMQNSPLGMTLVHSTANGLWIDGIKEGGIAAKTFLIAPPCRVLAVNDKPEPCDSWRHAVDELSSSLAPMVTLEYGCDYSVVTQPAETSKKLYVNELSAPLPTKIGPQNAAATA